MIEPVAPVGFQMQKELDSLAVGLDAFPAYIYKFNFDFKWDSIKGKVEQYLKDTDELRKKHGLGDPERDGGISSVHWNYANYKDSKYDQHPFGLPQHWPEFKEYYEYMKLIQDLLCPEWGYNPEWQRPISESWINVHPKGGWTGEHHHQNAIFATTAYLNKPKHSGHFMVRNPLENLKKAEPVDISYWNNKQYWGTIEVETNDVLIFPGWLTHKTEVNKSDGERFILSTNYVPLRTVDGVIGEIAVDKP